GRPVGFTNDDAFVHSVTDDHREWDSAGLPKNRPWKLVVKGPVSYHCSFHPSICGELVGAYRQTGSHSPRRRASRSLATASATISTKLSACGLSRTRSRYSSSVS